MISSLKVSHRQFINSLCKHLHYIPRPPQDKRDDSGTLLGIFPERRKSHFSPERLSGFRGQESCRFQDRAFSIQPHTYPQAPNCLLQNQGPGSPPARHSQHREHGLRSHPRRFGNPFFTYLVGTLSQNIGI